MGFLDFSDDFYQVASPKVAIFGNLLVPEDSEGALSVDNVRGDLGVEATCILCPPWILLYMWDPAFLLIHRVEDN